MVTPDFIEELKPNEVFVFGSNTAGVHGRGAALQARVVWGAKPGVGEGFTGREGCCYAFPTLNWKDTDERSERFSDAALILTQRTPDELMESAAWFQKCAEEHPEKTFLLTKIGCGLAGYGEDYMKQLFKGMPPNVIKPEGW